MTANQMYKQSGSGLPFKQWIEREKEKGVVIPQAGVTDQMSDDLKTRLKSKEENFSSFTKDNTVIGLNKTVLVISGLIIVGAIAYTIYKRKE
jgi:hypothetical protein